MNLLDRWLVGPLGQDLSFRSGFIAGLIVALVVGFLSQWVLYLWNLILQFFAATKRPATAPGPSPASTLGGCIGGGLLLVLVVVVLMGVLTGAFRV